MKIWDSHSLIHSQLFLRFHVSFVLSSSMLLCYTNSDLNLDEIGVLKILKILLGVFEKCAMVVLRMSRH